MSISSISSQEPTIYNGSRNQDFKNVLHSLLKKSNIKHHYIDIILSHDNMSIYNDVFTTQNVNYNNNYEVYEQLGDVIVNSFLVWYFHRRFPKLKCTEGVRVVARLRIKYAAKNTFYKIAENLGFWPFISGTTEERQTRKKDILEDVFEAFIGATVHILDTNFKEGVGYAVIYQILKGIFDKIPISLKYEDLYDSITRLKETFDYFKTPILGVQEKNFNRNDDNIVVCVLYRNFQNKKIEIGKGYASKKNDAEQFAAKNALDNLRKQGYIKPIPDIYNLYEQRVIT